MGISTLIAFAFASSHLGTVLYLYSNLKNPSRLPTVPTVPYTRRLTVQYLIQLYNKHSVSFAKFGKKKRAESSNIGGGSFCWMSPFSITIWFELVWVFFSLRDVNEPSFCMYEGF